MSGRKEFKYLTPYVSDFYVILATASLVTQTVKNLPAMWETWVRSLGWEDPLEKGNTISTPVFWPGEFHGLCSLWGPKESDMTVRFSLSILFKLRRGG